MNPAWLVMSFAGDLYDSALLCSITKAADRREEKM